MSNTFWLSLAKTNRRGMLYSDNDSLLHGMQGGLKLKIIETGRKIHQS